MKKLLGILVLGLLLTQFQHQTIKADDGLDEEDLLTAHIFSCWSIPLGLPLDEDLVVKIKLELNQDGTILRSEISDHGKNRLNYEAGQGFYSVLVESLLRAIRLCQPLIVPTIGYERSIDLQLNFDAKNKLLK